MKYVEVSIVPEAWQDEKPLVTDGGIDEISTGRYCCHCDADTVEVEHDRDGNEMCPRCKSSLYEDYAAYRDEMVRWLGERYNLSENDVIEILTAHGNPGKGQVSAILAEHDDGGCNRSVAGGGGR